MTNVGVSIHSFLFSSNYIYSYFAEYVSPVV